MTPAIKTRDSTTAQHGNMSSQHVDIPQKEHGQGHLKLTANKNKAEGEGGKQQVANGWGHGATSYEVEANGNEKKGNGGQYIAEKGEVRESDSSCSVL